MKFSSFLPLFLFACGGVIGGSDGGIEAGLDVVIKDGGSCSCGSTQYCQHDKTCGSTSGTCLARPNGCPDIYSPVCGNNGQVYPNECGANADGTDVSPTGGCIPPAGWVQCGPKFCDATTSYCQSTGNDAIGPGQPCTYFDCTPLPPACNGTTDCDCFGTTACSQQCTYDGFGFQIVCFGG